MDILKDEFDDFVRKAKALRKHRVNNAKLRDASNNEKAYSLGFAWGKL